MSVHFSFIAYYHPPKEPEYTDPHGLQLRQEKEEAVAPVCCGRKASPPELDADGNPIPLQLKAAAPPPPAPIVFTPSKRELPRIVRLRNLRRRVAR